MNEQIRTPVRWRWSVSDLDRMYEVGILRGSDRIELIDGEIIAISPKGNRHDLVKDLLAEFFGDRRPRGIRVSSESGWNPVEGAYFEPDLRAYPGVPDQRSVPGTDVRLLIEVADSSLQFDLGIKAEQYAKLGVRDYWVVEAWSLVTHVHREPSEAGYNSIVKAAPVDVLQPILLQGIELKMAELQLE